MKDVRLIPVPATMLPEAWPEIEPLLVPLADSSHGCFKIADYVRALDARDMQLWAAFDGQVVGAMLTEIQVYPQKKILNLIGASGRQPDRWLGLMPEIERWAKIEGCADIRATHRTGWRPLLEQMGFKKWHEVSEKKL